MLDEQIRTRGYGFKLVILELIKRQPEITLLMMGCTKFSGSMFQAFTPVSLHLR